MPTGKHEKTEYEKLRGLYRDTCPRHVVTFEASMTEDQKRHAFAYANDLRMLGNSAVAEIDQRMKQLFRTKAYRKLQKDYGWHCEHMKSLDPGSPRYQELAEERKSIASAMTKMQKEYGITFSDVRALTEAKAADYCVGSIFALTRGEDIWSACERILYDNGKYLHFRKNLQRAPYHRGLQAPFKGDGLPPAPGRVDEYNALTQYLAGPEVEERAVWYMKETGELTPVFRPCYVSLK